MQDAWTVDVALSDDLKQWKKTKKVIAQVVDQAAWSKYLVEQSSAAGDATDMQRMQIMLYDTFLNLPKADGFSFVSPPTGLCATVNIPKGKLKLFAYGDLKRDDGKPGHKVSGYALSSPKAVGDMDNVTPSSLSGAVLVCEAHHGSGACDNGSVAAEAWIDYHPHVHQFAGP